MNKDQLVRMVAPMAGVSMNQTKNVLDAFVNVVIEALSRGESVKMVGFGTFEVKRRAARVARNPKTKAPVQIPSRDRPTFAPGQWLLDAVTTK